MRIRHLLWPAAVALGLAASAPAQAQVTSTHITTPADPHFVLYDTTVEGPDSVAVSGTATGTGAVDLVCVRGAAVTHLQGSAYDVPVAADGTFSVPAAPLFAVAGTGTVVAQGQTCRLRAVPAGTTPDDLAPFEGPRLAVSRFAVSQVEAGDTHPVYDFYLYGAGLGAAADYRSFGGCGLYTTYFPEFDWAGVLPAGFYCNGYPARRRTPSEYGLEIDGEPAFPPAALGAPIGSGDTAGFPELGVGPVRLDPANGDVSITERNPLAKCGPDNGFPWLTECASFPSVPVELERTTDHMREGLLVRVVDRWSSTDGQPHRLDLALGQDHCFIDHSAGCSPETLYRFPGEAAYAARVSGAAAGPLPAREPILARGADDAPGGSAIVPAQSADGAAFPQPGTFELEYRNRTIPGDGELTLTHYYVTARTPAEAEKLSAELAASLEPMTAPQASPEPTTTALTAPVAGPDAGGGSVAPSSRLRQPRPTLSQRGAPRLRRSGRSLVVVTGDRVRCPAGGAPCVLRATATAGRGIVGRTRIQVPAGRTAKVALRLGRRGARTLRRVGRLRLSVALSAQVAAGTPVSRRRSFTVRLPR